MPFKDAPVYQKESDIIQKHDGIIEGKSRISSMFASSVLLYANYYLNSQVIIKFTVKINKVHGACIGEGRGVV